MVVEAAPILHKFVGQPSKNLGRWMRAMGDCEFQPLQELTHQYMWGNNERRAELKGRFCRIIAKGSMRTVLVEFENGERVTTSVRALKRIGDT